MKSAFLTPAESTKKEKGEDLARYIVWIYEVDQMPRRQPYIAFIEEQPVIKMILSHLGLLEARNHDPPTTRADPIPTFLSSQNL